MICSGAAGCAEQVPAVLPGLTPGAAAPDWRRLSLDLAPDQAPDQGPDQALASGFGGQMARAAAALWAGRLGLLAGEDFSADATGDATSDGGGGIAWRGAWEADLPPALPPALPRGLLSDWVPLTLGAGGSVAQAAADWAEAEATARARGPLCL